MPMGHTNDREHCLERARMHDRLAASTNDVAARQMHHAMATEFRRRAGQLGGATVPPPQPLNGETLEMSQPMI